MAQERENNPNWKGGRVVDPRGYVLIRVGVGHPLADVRGYAYEHRIKADAQPGEITSRAGVKGRDNRHLRPAKDSRRRRSGEVDELIECGCGCLRKLNNFDKWDRRRSFISGHNPRVVGSRF